MSQEELQNALNAAHKKCVSTAKACTNSAKALEKDIKASKKINRDKK